MEEKRLSNDAAEWAYNRYVRGDAEQEEFFEDLGILVGLAQQICDIREKLRMTRDNLAEFSGLPEETIRNLEETNYDGDWAEAIEKINTAFTVWVNEVLVPTHKTEPPSDYQVQSKAISA